MLVHERPDAAVLVGLDQYLGPVAVAKGQSIAPLILELEQRYGGLVEGHGFFCTGCSGKQNLTGGPGPLKSDRITPKFRCQIRIASVNCSKSAIHRKFHSLPELALEDHRLSSFSGLIVFQALFARLNLKALLNSCFRHLKVSPIFGHGVMVMVLVVHLLLGYRRLRDLRYYQDDPLVRLVLGLTRPPDFPAHFGSSSSKPSGSSGSSSSLNRFHSSLHFGSSLISAAG